ncbi:GNAT family N-acetyltransferase [Actinokineospora spheciospongiae]|uniref:GNAT family N-acetyltransferase n=1 Tax=Actinokineospora spheciospongiae TaxID=909613 RepID=UPI000D71A202|nr:GNAT family N-acetyltransferase [Actinokineospora spheciospongiae]PWW56144.1 acetyltransferase (GNAT) family protein [Actinokineospora spheciospongiae]
MKVRRAGEADTASLAALRRAWTEEDRGPVDDPGFDAAFADWLAAEWHHRAFWLAFDGETPVGSMNMLEFTRMPKPGAPASRWGHIGNAYVAPGHRDRGIGAEMLAAALAHADAEGYARVVLSPTERSVPFYGRHGFAPATSLLLRLPPG